MTWLGRSCARLRRARGIAALLLIAGAALFGANAFGQLGVDTKGKDDDGALTGVAVDTTSGTLALRQPDQDAIAQTLNNVPQNLHSLAEMANFTLAFAITQARDQALAGAHPIPDDIRRMLAPYFPETALSRARWNVVDPNRFSLESVMAINKDIDAITLDNVVIFPNCAMAMTRWDIWDHELVHVLQYAQIGVPTFAELYVATAGAALENEAYAWQHYVTRKIVATGQPLPMASPRTPSDPSTCM